MARWFIVPEVAVSFGFSRKLRELAGSDKVLEVRSGKAFQEFIAEQIDGIRGVQFRRMFGGYGIYADEVFFGILHGERLYFRTNDETRIRYVEAGMSWFMTPGGKKSVKAYYEVPATVIDRAKELRVWAGEAIKAARAIESADKRKSS